MDIARLGFSAETANLKNATADLRALKPAAESAASGVDKFNRAASGITGATGGASAGIKSFNAAVMGAGNSTGTLSKAALSAGTAMGTVQRAAAGANAQVNLLGQGAVRNAGFFTILGARVTAFLERLRAVTPAAAGAGSALDRLGKHANDNINRLQSTPGNIAAQFQDIGVTAAAGMNPMLIALQQGTQLSAAMAGGMGNLLKGFAQIISPVTLLTIGLVGLVAAGLQMINWIKVAQALMNGLADALDKLAVAAAYAGVVLAIAFAPQIIAKIAAITVSIAGGLVSALVSATTAMLAFAVANPFTAFVLAIGLVIAAMWALDDASGGIFTNILGHIKTAANFIIGAFVGAFNTVVAIWRDLPAILGDLAHQAAQRVRNEVNGLLTIKNTETGETWTPFSTGKMNNPYAGAAAKGASVGRAKFQAAMGVDYVGNAVSGIQSAASGAANWLRSKAAGLGAEAAGKTKKGSGASSGQTEAEKIAKAYQDLIDTTNKRITALQVETRALGMSENAAMLYRNQQELIAQALDKNIPLTDAVTKKLNELAQQLTNAQVAKAIAEQTKAFQDQQKVLKDQADLIGLTGYALEYASQRQKLLNDAVSKGIPIDTAYNKLLDERASILANASYGNQVNSKLAEENALNLTAELTDKIKKQREQIEFFRDTYKGFFTSMVDGLRQGQSVWEAFGNAVMNVVNKIIDRLLNMNGGILDKLVGLGGKLLGIASPQARLVPSVSQAFAENPGLFAQGGAFGQGGVQAFAKGGAFTNGVYDTPTLFKFAKGAAMGQMGEAGPEAVMPLKRGPDGSLGVQINGSQPIRVIVDTNDDRFNAYVDERSDGRIATHAPAIANAGSTIAQRTTAFKQSRRLK